MQTHTQHTFTHPVFYVIIHCILTSNPHRQINKDRQQRPFGFKVKLTFCEISVILVIPVKHDGRLYHIISLVVCVVCVVYGEPGLHVNTPAYCRKCSYTHTHVCMRTHTHTHYHHLHYHIVALAVSQLSHPHSYTHFTKTLIFLS